MTRTATAAEAKLTAFIARLPHGTQLDAYAAIADGRPTSPAVSAILDGADEKTRRVVASYLRREITRWRRAELEALPVRAVLDAAIRAEGTEPVGAVANLDAIIRDEWLEARFPAAVDKALEATEGDEDNLELYRWAFLRAAEAEIG